MICHSCGGYTRFSGLCPACERNKQLLRQQRDLAQQQLDNDVAERRHEVEMQEERLREQEERLREDDVRDIVKKLLDLAMEGLEYSDLAGKKVKMVMQSAFFTDNESEFFPEIKANIFLADCYYALRLGSQPRTAQFNRLSDYAQNFLKSWADTSRDARYAAKVSKLYSDYLSEKAKQAKADAEKKAEQARADAEKKAEQDKIIAKKRAEQTSLAIKGSTICSLLFLGGFLYVGVYQLPLWIETNLPAEISFFVLLLICLPIAFLASKNYIKEYLAYGSVTDHPTFICLIISGMILLVVTCLLWMESTGIFHVILNIVVAIGLPIIPFIRGIIGSVALGIAAGFVALSIAYCVGGVINFIS
jgi:glutaredoxin